MRWRYDHFRPEKAFGDLVRTCALLNAASRARPATASAHVR